MSGASPARIFTARSPPANACPIRSTSICHRPRCGKDKVYFGSGDGNVYALDAASRQADVEVQTGDVVHASPAIADGTVFVGSWDSYFYALDAKTGKRSGASRPAKIPTSHNQVGIQSSAVVADGVVYFGCRDSNLYALDARTGDKKWVFNNKGSWVIGSPVVEGWQALLHHLGLRHVLRR